MRGSEFDTVSDAKANTFWTTTCLDSDDPGSGTARVTWEAAKAKENRLIMESILIRRKMTSE